MSLFAIADTHLSLGTDKPMDIFKGWSDYVERLEKNWRLLVNEDDTVVIAGDISWAMKLEECEKDFTFLENLPGKKIILKGNHDYWWKSISQIRAALPCGFYALQNDCVKFGNKIICGSRGWCVEGSPDFKEQDRKIYLRETERLKLALSAAEKVREDGDEIYCMVHFPPFNARRENSLFTDLFESKGVSKVIYGHLHGSDSRTDLKIVKNGVVYYLTSCDQVNNELTLIGEFL